MKKYIIRCIGMIFAVAALFAAAVIALNEIYYKDTFPMGVWINGIYCTGMTPEEVTDRLDSTVGKTAFQSVKVRCM